MSDVLRAITAAAKRSADERERRLPRPEVERLAASVAPRGQAFRDRLTQPGVQVIAECKRRSPSRGVLRSDYDPAAIAKAYAEAGAAAISVLTEPSFFDGSLDDLRSVRAAVTLPILRKDFIVTDYQVVEARAAGADAVLLIVAALGDVDLRRLLSTSASCELAALVEVHTAEELLRALGAGATIVGVNSRDLRTLTVDTSVFDKLIYGVPGGVTAVAESGLASGAEMGRLRNRGFDAFLIGERFMSAPDPGAALRDLIAEAAAVPEKVVR